MVAKARMYGESPTVFWGTRYGNVMASRGSVIPLFLNQILAGGALTITDPYMTRFMMTIEGDSSPGALMPSRMEPTGRYFSIEGSLRDHRHLGGSPAEASGCGE